MEELSLGSLGVLDFAAHDAGAAMEAAVLSALRLLRAALDRDVDLVAGIRHATTTGRWAGSESGSSGEPLTLLLLWLEFCLHSTYSPALACRPPLQPRTRLWMQC